MKDTRQPFLFGLLSIFSILLFSFYLEYVRSIYPCPLCELQRITFMLLGVFFLIGTLLHRVRIMRYISLVFVWIISCLGTILATKQVWLQHNPDEASSTCVASLGYLLHMFPIQQVIEQIFAGSPECTERGWDFLSLDLAEWALISFVGFFIFSAYCLVKEWRHSKRNRYY